MAVRRALRVDSVGGTHHAATFLHPGAFPACLCNGSWFSYGALDRSMPPTRFHPIAPTRSGEARVITVLSSDHKVERRCAAPSSLHVVRRRKFGLASWWHRAGRSLRDTHGSCGYRGTRTPLVPSLRAGALWDLYPDRPRRSFSLCEMWHVVTSAGSVSVAHGKGCTPHSLLDVFRGGCFI